MVFYTIIASVVIIKTKDQIHGIRQSSHLAAAALKYVSSLIKPGVTTEFLNQAGHKFIVDHKAIPAPLNYGGYPKSICTSVNDTVCHGIPSDKIVLKSGDIINIDITTVLNGYFGDVSASFPVDQISKEAQDLTKRTKTSLDMSIKSLSPGKFLNDCVGKIIEPYVSQFGYSVVRDLGGHGVGLKFHEDPFVYHFDTSRDDIILRPGMIFTIEPMINASSEWRVYIDSKDGWTVRTLDGSLSCQFEHTVLITPSGHEVLTV